jgi:hypothetical protein
MKEQDLETRVDEQTVMPPERATASENEPIPSALTPTPTYRVWAMHCPFRKDGAPVVGSFGRSVEPVVIMKMATWKRLCADVPQLQATQFEVGSFD